MAGTTNNLRALQGVGIVAAGYASGAIFGFSNVGVPPLLLAPTNLMLKQWSDLFSRGFRTGPPAMMVATLSFGYVAYALPSMRKLYAASALLPFMIMPYTQIFMLPLNDELHRREATASKLPDSAQLADVKGEASSAELVSRWRTLNYIRSLLPLAGGLLGAYSALVA